MVKMMKKNVRFTALMLFICIISSSFLMIVPLNYLNMQNQVDFSSIIEDEPLPTHELVGDGYIPNITTIWFNGDVFDPSILWNVTSNQVVNITASITSADPLWEDDTRLYYDTNITDETFPIPIMFTNTTDINSGPLENTTINKVALNGTATPNFITALAEDDGESHAIQNGTDGIMMPYSINLTSLGYDNDFDELDKVIIDLEGSVTTLNNTFAGLMIWNWSSNSLVNVSSSWFNSTTDIQQTLTLENSSQFNITDFIDNSNNSRIELFLKVQSNTSIAIVMDYIYFQVKKDPKQGIYSALIPGLPWDKHDEPVRKSPVFFWINVTDEDGTNTTLLEEHNYSIVDNTPPQVEISITNHSYVSGLTTIWINVTDMESGIHNISLTIDKNETYNQSVVWSHADIVAQDPNLNNVSFSYNWDVSEFMDYNGTNAPENATHILNFTIWNRAGPRNLGIDQAHWESRYETTGNYTVYVDNEDPFDPYLNVRSNDEDTKYLNELTDFEKLKLPGVAASTRGLSAGTDSRVNSGIPSRTLVKQHKADAGEQLASYFSEDSLKGKDVRLGIAPEVHEIDSHYLGTIRAFTGGDQTKTKNAWCCGEDLFLPPQTLQHTLEVILIYTDPVIEAPIRKVVIMMDLYMPQHDTRSVAEHLR